MNLDGLSTAAGAAPSPGATTHGPAAEALLKGAEYDAETEDAAEALEATAAAAAAQVRPPGLSSWGTMTKKQKKNSH